MHTDAIRSLIPPAADHHVNGRETPPPLIAFPILHHAVAQQRRGDGPNQMEDTSAGPVGEGSRWRRVDPQTGAPLPSGANRSRGAPNPKNHRSKRNSCSFDAKYDATIIGQMFGPLRATAATAENEGVEQQTTPFLWIEGGGGGGAAQRQRHHGQRRSSATTASLDFSLRPWHYLTFARDVVEDEFRVFFTAHRVSATVYTLVAALLTFGGIWLFYAVATAVQQVGTIATAAVWFFCFAAFAALHVDLANAQRMEEDGRDDARATDGPCGIREEGDGGREDRREATAVSSTHEACQALAVHTSRREALGATTSLKARWILNKEPTAKRARIRWNAALHEVVSVVVHVGNFMVGVSNTMVPCRDAAGVVVGAHNATTTMPSSASSGVALLCISTINANPLMLLAMITAALLVPLRSVLLVPLYLVCSVIFWSMRAIPQVPYGSPPHQYACSTIIVLTEMVICLIASHVREQRSRANFRVHVERHLQSSKMEYLRQQMARLADVQLPKELLVQTSARMHDSDAARSSHSASIPPSLEGTVQPAHSLVAQKHASSPLIFHGQHAVVCVVRVVGLAAWASRSAPSDIVAVLRRIAQSCDDALLAIQEELRVKSARTGRRDGLFHVRKATTIGDDICVVGVPADAAAVGAVERLRGSMVRFAATCMSSLCASSSESQDGVNEYVRSLPWHPEMGSSPDGGPAAFFPVAVITEGGAGYRLLYATRNVVPAGPAVEEAFEVAMLVEQCRCGNVEDDEGKDLGSAAAPTTADLAPLTCSLSPTEFVHVYQENNTSCAMVLCTEPLGATAHRSLPWLSRTGDGAVVVVRSLDGCRTTAASGGSIHYVAQMISTDRIPTEIPSGAVDEATSNPLQINDASGGAIRRPPDGAFLNVDAAQDEVSSNPRGERPSVLITIVPAVASLVARQHQNMRSSCTSLTSGHHRGCGGVSLPGDDERSASDRGHEATKGSHGFEAEAAAAAMVIAERRVDMEATCLLMRRFVDTYTEMEFAQYLSLRGYAALDVLISLGGTTASLLALLVVAVLDETQTDAAYLNHQHPYIWSCVGLLFAAVGFLCNAPATCFAELPQCLVAVHGAIVLYLQRINVALSVATQLSYLSVCMFAPIGTFLHEAQSLFIIVMINSSILRPMYNATGVMWLRDCAMCSLMLFRSTIRLTTTGFSALDGTISPLSMYLAGSCYVITLAIRVLLDRWRREVFATAKLLDFQQEELEADYHRLEDALDAMVPAGVAAQLVRRVRAQEVTDDWDASETGYDAHVRATAQINATAAEPKRLLHPLWSASANLKCDDGAFLLLEVARDALTHGDANDNSILSGGGDADIDGTPDPWTPLLEDINEAIPAHLRRVVQVAQCNISAALIVARERVSRKGGDHAGDVGEEPRVPISDEQLCAHLLAVARSLRRWCSSTRRQGSVGSVPCRGRSSRRASLRVRMVLDFGPAMGALIGQGAAGVVFGYFGPCLTISQAVLRHVEWGTVLASERFMRVIECCGGKANDLGMYSALHCVKPGGGVPKQCYGSPCM